MQFYKRILGVACLGVFFICLTYCLVSYPVDDFVVCQGDSPDYQALAVNVVKGHGYRAGGVEPFNVYQIKGCERDPGFLADFRFQNGYDFYRDPGYPLFMSLIYSLGGIHPQNVKIAQIILLSISVAFLVVLGYLFWGRMGIISGSIAGVLYVFFYAFEPGVIMAEPLFVTSMGIWAAVYIFWRQGRTGTTTAILGVTSALMLLIKEVCLFIPLIWLVYYMCWIKEDGKAKKFKYIIIYSIAMLVTFLPWSIYIRSKAGNVVLTTTHARNALLDGNNEDSFEKGNWRPDWRKEHVDDKRYFYNRDEIRDKPYVQQYFGFLYEYRAVLPKLYLTKIRRAFTYNKFYFWCLFLMAWYYFLWRMVLFSRRLSCECQSGYECLVRFPEVPVFFLINLLLTTTILYAYDRFTALFMYFFVPCAVHGIVLSVWLIGQRVGKDRVKIKKWLFKEN